MNMLLLFFLVSLLLGWALIRFVRVDKGGQVFGKTPGERHRFFDDANFQVLGDAIFSERDWNFIRKEASPALKKLFLQERRAVAAHWLNDSVARIRDIRANHLQRSRHSQDLDALAEAKLLLLFFYLTVLCRCLLLIVRLTNPIIPRSLALHFQGVARKLAPYRGGIPPHATAEGFDRSRL
jgi:hypothetical protein